MLKNILKRSLNLISNTSQIKLLNQNLIYKSFAIASKFNRHKNSKPEQFRYKIEEFNPKGSKYSLKSEPTPEQANQEEFSPGVAIPKYLEMEEYNKTHGVNDSTEGETPRRGISLKGLKPGKRMTIIKPKFQKKMTKEELQENRKQILLESALKEKNSRIGLSKQEIYLLDNNENSVSRSEEKYVTVEKQKYKDEIIKMKNEKHEEKTNGLFNVENLVDFKKEERLSKRLSRLGVTSRRQAEKLIENGMIKINGKTVKQNVPVTDEANIQVYSSNGYKTPMSESTRVWLFYKPVGVSCTQNEEKNKMTVHKFMEAKKFTYKHFSIAGKLDINSEGLVILTNNGDLAAALENNDTIERAYKIRVFGRMFTEDKLNKIRTGVKINMKTIKLWTEFINKQNSNTWVHVKAYNNSIIDIRNVFRKMSLRINRIIRTNYGPYSLGVLKNPGEVTEANIPKSLNNYMYYRMKEKTQTMMRKLDDTKLEQVKLDMLKEQRKTLGSGTGEKKLKKIEKVNSINLI